MTANPIDVLVGAQLRELRLHNGLSVYGLARMLGMTKRRIVEFERGETRIGAAAMLDICRALKAVPMAFFAWPPREEVVASAAGGDLHAA
jgi:transcriptional regulator with XRE-family HTH domain